MAVDQIIGFAGNVLPFLLQDQRIDYTAQVAHWNLVRAHGNAAGLLRIGAGDFGADVEFIS
jgi:hypothetical protein